MQFLTINNNKLTTSLSLVFENMKATTASLLQEDGFVCLQGNKKTSRSVFNTGISVKDVRFA